MNENEIGTLIVKTAIHVHKNLGPGLLESEPPLCLRASVRDLLNIFLSVAPPLCLRASVRDLLNIPSSVPSVVTY